jgi:UDPglucose 6-dehydrogenase
MKIGVVGSGYVGLVAGACLAELGHDVVLVDDDKHKLSALRRAECPIHEKFLPELLQRQHNRRLQFTADLSQAVGSSQVVFIAVGTPPTEHGNADLSYVESVAQGIAGAIHDYKTIVVKCTVPVYTSNWIRRILLLNGAPAGLFDVACNPEFLREGSAVSDFLYPDRIVLGVDNDRCAQLLRRVYQPLLDGSYYARVDAIPGPAESDFKPRLLCTSSKSAELIKHASNAFLAMKISFANAVACLCEAVEADVRQVCEGIGSDSRIGDRFLQPGLGFGGSCLPKDLLAFRAVAREYGCNFGLLDETTRVNDEQRNRFLHKVRKALWTLKGKRLAVLGLAFKNGTDDVRESPALTIVKALLKEGCSITAYDPAAMSRAAEQLADEPVRFAQDAYEALRGADACLVLTEWEEFATLDLARVKKLLRYPIVIDGRNLFNPASMEAAGLNYLSVGRPDVVLLDRGSAVPSHSSAGASCDTNLGPGSPVTTAATQNEADAAGAEP